MVAPSRAFALLVLSSSVLASNLHVRQAASSVVAVSATPVASTPVVSASPAAATSAAPVVVSTPAAAASTAASTPTSAAVAVPATTTPVSTPTNSATTAATSKDGNSNDNATPTPASMTSSPSSSSTASSASSINANSALNSPSTGISTTVIVVLVVGGVAIILAGFGIYLFRRWGVPKSDKFKARRQSNAAAPSGSGATTANNSYVRSIDQLENGTASAAMIDFGRVESALPKLPPKTPAARPTSGDSEFDFSLPRRGPISLPQQVMSVAPTYGGAPTPSHYEGYQYGSTYSSYPQQ